MRHLHFFIVILLLITIISSSFANEKIENIVVTDLDDTIVKTNVLNKLEASLNTFIRNPKPFSRLIDIYKDMKTESSDLNQDFSIHYVSAAPRALPRQEMLDDFGAPEGTLYQRKNHELFSLPTLEYKVNKITEILKQKLKDNETTKKQLNVFFFGDNGEYDPEAYLAVMDNPDFKDITFHTYIRKVQDKASLSPQIKYFLSEKELQADPFLKIFVSNQTKSNIKSDELRGTLIPKYILERFPNPIVSDMSELSCNNK